MSEAVLYEVTDRVATITLNRPGKLNAFDAPMLQALREAFDRAEADEEVRVVALTGAGRAFSSGQDLAALDGGEGLNRILDENYAPLVRRLMAFPKVTVAALNGAALGAGASIALACDIMVAARSGWLQLAFVRIGLIPDAGATWLAPRMLGSRRALALALTGDRIPAQEARDMGLVHRIFDDADFAASAHAFAVSLAQGSATAQRLIKAAFRQSEAHGLEEQLQLEAALQDEAGRSADFAEALVAFKEKRAPAFR